MGRARCLGDSVYRWSFSPPVCGVLADAVASCVVNEYHHGPLGILLDAVLQDVPQVGLLGRSVESAESRGYPDLRADALDHDLPE